MHTDFWLERWQAGQIGFHQDSIHPYLIRHFSTLNVPDGACVFVPLSGKSMDMHWLMRQGYSVIGVEISQQAVEEFFAENRIIADIRQTDDFTIYEAAGIQLYCGDFFSLDASLLGRCQAVYDRASLIALPVEMRMDYVRQMRNLFPNGLETLLITLDYRQAEMSGPPFSVGLEEVNRLYRSSYEINLLERTDIIELETHFQQKGVSAMYEAAYRLQPV